MTGIDVGIIILLLAFVCYGWKFGFVHTVGGIIGAIASIFIAAKIYEPLANSSWGVALGGNTNLGKIISFAVIFFALTRIIGIAIWIIDKFTNFLSVIPFVEGINKLVGAILGFFEGLIVIAGIVYVAGKYPIAESFGISLAGSKIATIMNSVVRVFEPFFPDMLSKLRSVFDVPVGKASDYLREYFKF
ncbi:MAG: CvpA family protein [bacterium]